MDYHCYSFLSLVTSRTLSICGRVIPWEVLRGHWNRDKVRRVVGEVVVLRLAAG